MEKSSPVLSVYMAFYSKMTIKENRAILFVQIKNKGQLLFFDTQCIGIKEAQPFHL